MAVKQLFRMAAMEKVPIMIETDLITSAELHRGLLRFILLIHFLLSFPCFMIHFRNS